MSDIRVIQDSLGYITQELCETRMVLMEISQSLKEIANAWGKKDDGGKEK